VRNSPREYMPPAKFNATLPRRQEVGDVRVPWSSDLWCTVTLYLCSMTSLALGFFFVGAATSRAREGILTGLCVETRYWEYSNANRAKSATTQLARTSDTSLVRPAAQAVAQSR